jgi:putative hydrolase of the HAD superfamily
VSFRPVSPVSFHGPRLRALLLDALGTLVRLEAPAPRLRDELAARFGLEVSEAEAAGAIAAEIAYYRSHLDEGSSTEGLASLRARCASVLRGALPPSERLAAVSADALTDALLASLRFDAYADARPALARARELGIRLVVVSNWDVSLHEVLGRLGLAPLLDGVLTSAEAGGHVGDSLEEDIAGARNAGIVPVLIRREGAPAAARDRAPGGLDCAAITRLTDLFETTT